MAAQIPLRLEQPLRYSSSSFVVHRGVADVVSLIVKLAHQQVFSTVYLQGPAKSGKTHTGVFLVGHLQELGKFARMLSRDEVSPWCASKFGGEPLRSGETIVIDDGDLFLAEISQTNQSGVFMDLAEQLHRVDGTLLLLGASSPEALVCSKQIRSRLDAGLHFAIGGPAEEELDRLLNVITKQRGLQLTDAKRSYILRRVARTLPAIVECIERVDDPSDFSAPRTSFHVLSGALAKESETRRSTDPKNG